LGGFFFCVFFFFFFFEVFVTIVSGRQFLKKVGILGRLKYNQLYFLHPGTDQTCVATSSGRSWTCSSSCSVTASGSASTVLTSARRRELGTRGIQRGGTPASSTVESSGRWLCWTGRSVLPVIRLYDREGFLVIRARIIMGIVGWYRTCFYLEKKNARAHSCSCVHVKCKLTSDLKN